MNAMNLLTAISVSTGDSSGSGSGFWMIPLVVGIGVWSAYKGYKRRQALHTKATQMGWTIIDRDDSVLTNWSWDFFAQGFRRDARNVVSGAHDGRDFVAFDYTYYTRRHTKDGPKTESHTFGVLAMYVGVDFPALEVSPENAVERAVGRLTNTDIQFESEAFNRAFRVTCPDRKFASDVLHPRMMEMLLAHPKRGWTFRDGWVFSVSGTFFPVEEIDPRLEMLDGLLDTIPTFVWPAAVRAGVQAPVSSPAAGWGAPPVAPTPVVTPPASALPAGSLPTARPTPALGAPMVPPAPSLPALPPMPPVTPQA